MLTNSMHGGVIDSGLFIKLASERFGSCRFAIFKPFKLKTTYIPYSGSRIDPEILLEYRSVIAYSAYTDVAADYYIRETVTPWVVGQVRKLARPSSPRIYNDYSVSRKEVAVRAGLGKIGYNGLLHDNKFGFNCKLDFVATDVELHK